MKKLLAIFLSLSILATFSACGGVSENADQYIAYSISMLGIEMQPSELYDEDIVLTLDENGKAMLSLDGETYNCKWEMDGDVFTLSKGSDSFTGTKEDDVVTVVNLLNMDLNISFLKEGATLPQVSAAPSQSGTTSPPEGTAPPKEVATAPQASTAPSQAGTTPSQTATTPPEDTTKPTGKYILCSMNAYGTKMSYADVLAEGASMEYHFKEDGTVELHADGAIVEVPIDYNAKTITIGALVYDFVLDGEQLSVISEDKGLTMFFLPESSKKWEELKAQASAGGGSIEPTNPAPSDTFVAPGYGAETTIPAEYVPNPSNWYGIITITDYMGPYASIMEGEHEAWASVSNDGTEDYFEIYVTGIYDNTDVILSFYIYMDGAAFYPIIDSEALIFDTTLTQRDQIRYVPTLTDGVLSASYDYEDIDESFTFKYELAMIDE